MSSSETSSRTLRDELQSTASRQSLNLDPSPSPPPSPNQDQPQEPNLSGGVSSEADAGELGAEFASAGQEQQPEPEVLPPELLTADEFQRRFASWFDAPGAVLSGQPTEEMRDRAARALHAEIVKSGSTWLRALASRKVGSVGNWGIVAMFVAALVKNAADQAKAAAMQTAPNHAAGAPEGGQQWPPKGGL